MAAIEYGSYYWCVILHGKEPKLPGDSIHLHADEISIDPAGSLIFTSAGRRPAGAEPKQQDSEQGGDSNPKGKVCARGLEDGLRRKAGGWLAGFRRTLELG